jgi:hypothetical protein
VDLFVIHDDDGDDDDEDDDDVKWMVSIWNSKRCPRTATPKQVRGGIKKENTTARSQEDSRSYWSYEDNTNNMECNDTILSGGT